MPSSRFNRADWPDAGPHRDLLQYLDEVHVQYGCRSLRDIGRPMHLSYARVHSIVRGFSLPVDDAQTRSLVLALVGTTDGEVQSRADRAVDLFGKARLASAQPAGVPRPRTPRFRMHH